MFLIAFFTDDYVEKMCHLKVVKIYGEFLKQVVGQFKTYKTVNETKKTKELYSGVSKIWLELPRYNGGTAVCNNY